MHTARARVGRALIALFLLQLFAVSSLLAAAPPADFTDTLVTNLASPTALAFTPDGRLLLTQQTGQLRVYQGTALLATPALDLSGELCTNSERGLLGVAVDPVFATNHFIYLYYTYNPFHSDPVTCPTGQPTNPKIPVNRVSRFVFGDNNLATFDKILIDNIPSPNGNHNGGDLHFGQDGYLYISVGDGGADYAGVSGGGGANDATRDQFILLGKILRIAPDGSIPADNPFVGADSARCNTAGRTTAQQCQETFAWGLRNPFRFAVKPGTSQFYINDVGQNAWEEIDVGQKGADYGWNCREATHTNSTSGKCSPTPANMVDPIYEYGHGSCNSISGGAFVPASLWPAQYDGSYLFADYVCNKIFRLVANGSSYSAVDFVTNAGGPVAMTFGPFDSSQALYYAAIGSGQIRRVAYTGNANRSPNAMIAAAPSSGPAPLAVDFDATGSSDPDGDPLTYDWDFGDATPHATTAQVTHQYALGTYTATLRVSDGKGGTGTATARIDSGNTAPVLVISAPNASLRYRVGQQLTLQGSASDAEDGLLAESNLSWKVILHHNAHTHPFLPPTSGSNVSITTIPPEDLAATSTSYLELELTATDSKGLTGVITQELRPNLVDITFATMPNGRRLLVNGDTITATRRLVSWEAYTLSVSAPLQKNDSGVWLALTAWADGGPVPTRAIVTPAASTTYTAIFTPAKRWFLPLGRR
ncbi:MAG: PQQ-dependent sugar dehydrogenase [Roseiflexaceae bacterium]